MLNGEVEALLRQRSALVAEKEALSRDVELMRRNGSEEKQKLREELLVLEGARKMLVDEIAITAIGGSMERLCRACCRQKHEGEQGEEEATAVALCSSRSKQEVQGSSGKASPVRTVVGDV